MAKPNYSFEKRQRELVKKKKKEEKVKEKSERKQGDGSADAGTDAADGEVAADAPNESGSVPT